MQSGAGASSLRYRRDVDGLRAVAVLLVIGFHAFPNLATGGYVGVDVFFVISGFLITGLLLNDLNSKRFSFVGFYARRIRRIFPALVVVLLACFGAGWILLLPDELASLGLNIFGGAAFTSNLVLLGQTGYFDLSAAEKPLLHLWSLGVEEQFYVIWPLVLMFAFWRRVSIVVAACVFFALSFLANLAVTGTAAAFYLPVTRAWELMIGSALAALSSGDPTLGLPQKWKRTWTTLARNIPPPLLAISSSANVGAFIGLGLVGIAALALKKTSDFPGWAALLPTVGTALILTSSQAWLNRVVLGSPAAVLIGLISYPLYLWHWPLLSFATIADPAGTTPQLRSAAVLFAFALAWLTYRWVERPIRAGLPRRFTTASLCAAMTIIGAVGLGAFEWHGFPDRIPPAIRDITKIPINEVADWRLHTCLLENNETASQLAPDCIDRKKRPLLFLWGDSYAAALYPGLKRLQRTTPFSLAQYTTAGCPPLLSFPILGHPYCVETNKVIFSILSDVRPDVVLLYSSWGYGGVIPPLSRLIGDLRALQIPHILVMGTPPFWDGGLPKAAYDYYRADPLHRMLPLRSSYRVSDLWYNFEKNFRAQVQAMDVDYISAWNVFCNDKECQTRPDNNASQLVAFDYAHLTIPGAVYLAEAIAPCLLNAVPKGHFIDHVCYRSKKFHESRGY